MTSTIPFGALKLDARDYASQGNAILGIRDSGKSYTATYIAERLFEAGVPFVAFDPIGRWRFLRVAGKGDGYPVVVAGGEHGDLPLTPSSAPEIVRAAMAEGVSLVIDLYAMSLSKADWKRIVQQSVAVMLYENKKYGLRHIFIEEAAEFVPQRVGPDQGQVYAEIEKLARMGGNALLGYTLINQRGEEVNKAVLELCDGLFLHRQKGRNSLTALGKWLDIASAQGGEKIIDSLPTLPQGECWVWAAGSDKPVHVKVPGKRTFEPDRRAMRDAKVETSRHAINVSTFVEHMSASLAKFTEEAKANDPKALKAEIARLRREAGKPAADHAAMAAARAEGRAEGERAAMASLASSMDRRDAKIAQAAEDAKAALARLTALLGQAVPAPQVTYRAPSKINAATKTYSAAKPRPARLGTNGHGMSLPVGEKAVLRACAQYPDGVGRDQLSVLIGYKRSSRDAYIARLKEKGLVDADASGVRATGDGIAALGSDYEPLPTGEALQEYWLARLPEGERKILGELIAAYPEPVERDRLDQATGYKRSSRDAYISRLSARRLVAIKGRGEIAASETLFG